MDSNGKGDFTGKVAFVTGAANGIGRAAALAFARESAGVVVADVSEKDNQQTARMIEDLGGHALAVSCDVSRNEDVRRALDATIKTFGRLDFAFNNAGIEYTIQPAADVTEEEWDRILGIDLRGVFLCMKHEIPLLLKQGGGAIVNTSSGAWGQRLQGRRGLRRREAWRRWPDEGGGPRLRAVEHPHQRGVSWYHQHADDGSLQWWDRRRTAGGDRAGTGGKNGNAGRDRRGGGVVVFGCGQLRRRQRHDRRRRPDGVTAFDHL